MRKVKRVDGVEVDQLYPRLEKILTSSRLWVELTEDRKENALRTLQDENPRPYDSLHFEWNRAWGVTCNLYINFESSYKENVQIGDKYAKYVTGRVQVSWSSTNRTPSEARAAIVLYNEVNDLACLLEALINEASYYILYDLKPQEVSPEATA